MEGRGDLVCVRTTSDPSCAEAHPVRCGYVPWPTSFARFAGSSLCPIIFPVAQVGSTKVTDLPKKERIPMGPLKDGHSGVKRLLKMERNSCPLSALLQEGIIRISLDLFCRRRIKPIGQANPKVGDRKGSCSERMFLPIHG
jgi:hypothetical protein